MKDYIAAHLAMGCAGVTAMPNTRPPVGKIFESDDLPYWSIETYRDSILKNGGDVFDFINIPLYLTKDTTAGMIEVGAKSGLLKSCKYYPPHGTTNSDQGRPLQTFIENDVFAAMEANGVILNVHGEEHALPGNQYFDKETNAEDIFYRDRLPKVVDHYPDLKIVCEHITTRTAVEFVNKASSKIGATITPQHLLYTVGDLVQGFRFHLYCLPLVKFSDDRAALCDAVNNSGQTKFFAGTDSAPHTTKATECGCAAGCFTGLIAPQLYAQAFDLTGGQHSFEAFLCRNGAAFYGLPVSEKTFTLSDEAPTELQPLQTADGEVFPLPLGLGKRAIPWSLTL